MHTGDLGVMDDEGYVNITGRIKDMVIRGGENVYPREIEEFLYTHPDVLDAQVIGVPDAKYGEELWPGSKLRDGAPTLTAEAVREFAAGKLAHYKIPRYVHVVDEFPMTVTGKIRKVEMREKSRSTCSTWAGPPCAPIRQRVTRGTGVRSLRLTVRRVAGTIGGPARPGRFVARGAFVVDEERVSKVPTGRVKWYDADKGFGFLAQDGGEDVYVRRAALPAGVEALKPGQRVEFGMAEGRRGPQALPVRLLESPPSVVEAARRPAEDLHSLIEDMIKLLETQGAARPAPRPLPGPAYGQARGRRRPRGGPRPRRLTPRPRRVGVSCAESHFATVSGDLGESRAVIASCRTCTVSRRPFVVESPTRRRVRRGRCCGSAGWR